MNWSSCEILWVKYQLSIQRRGFLEGEILFVFVVVHVMLQVFRSSHYFFKNVMIADLEVRNAFAFKLFLNLEIVLAFFSFLVQVWFGIHVENCLLNISHEVLLISHCKFNSFLFSKCGTVSLNYRICKR